MSATFGSLASTVASDRRRLAGTLALACAGALAGGMFVQHVLGFPPCSLCILQRVAFFAALTLSLPIAVLPLRRGARLVLAALALVAVVLGLGVASYQVWMNAFSGAVARCARGIAQYFEETPVEGIASWVLAADGDCGNPPRFFGFVTMPQLGFVTFAVLALASVQLQIVCWTDARRVRSAISRGRCPTV